MRAFLSVVVQVHLLVSFSVVGCCATHPLANSRVPSLILGTLTVGALRTAEFGDGRTGRRLVPFHTKDALLLFLL